jgi:hypothetical protein
MLIESGELLAGHSAVVVAYDDSRFALRLGYGG